MGESESLVQNAATRSHQVTHNSYSLKIVCKSKGKVAHKPQEGQHSQMLLLTLDGRLIYCKATPALCHQFLLIFILGGERKCGAYHSVSCLRTTTPLLFHTVALPHHCFSTPPLLHTSASPHCRSSTLSLLHTTSLPHRHSSTPPLHRSSTQHYSTQLLLHTTATLHCHSSTPPLHHTILPPPPSLLLHAAAPPHPCSSTPSLLHTTAPPHRRSTTLLHLQPPLLHTAVPPHCHSSTPPLQHNTTFPHHHSSTPLLLHRL